MNRTQLVAFILVGFGLLGGSPNEGAGMILSLFAGLGLIVFCVLNLVDDVMSVTELSLPDLFHFDMQHEHDIMDLIESEYVYSFPRLRVKPEHHGRHNLCVYTDDERGEPEKKTHVIDVKSVVINKHGKGLIRYVLLNKSKSSASVEVRAISMVGTRVAVGGKVSEVFGKWSPVFW